MASENAAAVAREVIETVRKGLKVDKGDIIRNHGYSDSISKKPKKVTETKTYKDIIKPFVEQLQDEIKRIQTELSTRDLGDEKYKDLVDSLDKLNKQVILANGGETERIGLVDQTPIKAMTQEQVDEYLKNKLNESTERIK